MQNTGILEKISVRESGTLSEVIQALQSSSFMIALVVDSERKLLGTITDGDCRRALLKKNSLDVTAKDIMNEECIKLLPDSSIDKIVSLAATKGVWQIPIVNASGVTIGIFDVKNSLHQQFPNEVVIMAGGRGQRLAPLTNSMPKPMLPVQGVPILEKLIDQLVKSGLLNITISVNYKKDIIMKHFGDGSNLNCRIRYLQEVFPSGTAGSLSQLSPETNFPLIVINGDLVTQINFSKLLEFHKTSSADFTIAFTNHTYQVPFGVLDLKENGRINEVIEKPNYIYSTIAGVYVLNKIITDEIQKDSPCDMPDLIERAIAKNYNVMAFPVHESWNDIGTIEQYTKIQNT